jgi:hypothetical protein
MLPFFTMLSRIGQILISPNGLFFIFVDNFSFVTLFPGGNSAAGGQNPAGGGRGECRDSRLYGGRYRYRTREYCSQHPAGFLGFSKNTSLERNLLTA